MSKIQIISSPNGNESLTDIRAEYLDGCQSFALLTVPSHKAKDIQAGMAAFQKVADTMLVVRQADRTIFVTGPDGAYFKPSDCVSASAYITDMIQRKAGLKPA